MENLIVQTPSGPYTIFFGAQIWDQVREIAKSYDKVLIVSDDNVAPLYGERLPFPILTITPGEEQKTLDTIAALAKDWAARGLDRRSLVIALGGGVMGDLVGFAASIYLRGISYLQIPTTLLAQVDSSVGGKTGVNTSQGKNLLGTFYQPQGVFIDPAVLKTLEPREITNGLGEVFKYGIIADPALFALLQENLAAFYELELEIVGPVIRRCCQLKSEIVAADEQDRGVRKVLNLGHTFGHALEVVTGYEFYNHGEAVLMGMLLEARLAKALGLLPETAFQEIAQGLGRIKLNWILPKLTRSEFMEALLHDKKNRGGKISFILPKQVGQVTEVLLSPAELIKHWERVMEG